jgi:hypothetical protein
MPKRIIKAPKKTSKKVGGICVMKFSGKTSNGKSMHGELKFAGPATSLMLMSEAFTEGLTLVIAEVHVEEGKKKGRK